MPDPKFCASEEPNLQVPVLLSWSVCREGIKDPLKMAAEVSGEGEPPQPAKGHRAGAGLEGAPSGMKSDGTVGLPRGGGALQAKTQAQALGGRGQRKGWGRGAHNKAEKDEKKLGNLEGLGDKGKEFGLYSKARVFKSGLI